MDSNPAAKEALFHEALAPPPAKRDAFLDRACGADAALRAEPLALLAAHEDPESLTFAPLPAPTALAREEKTGDRIGRNRLLQKIGQGGCGGV